MKEKPKNPDRREFLKKGMAAAVGAALFPGAVLASEQENSEEWYSMLYDSTKCIGCKSCSVACKRVNHLPPELEKDGIHDDAIDLSAKTKTIIKLYKSDDGRSAFVKRQCMHCLDPACVSACPVSAMRKDRTTGIVYWNGNRCIGCRYCMVACPFEVPKFEWENPIPHIVKCDLCKDTYLKEKGITACADVCPTGAIIFGKRGDLLIEAKMRIKKNPERYNPVIYGEYDGGGTSVMYLAPKGVSFQELGFPRLEKSPAEISESIQHGIYESLVPPFLALGALYFLLKPEKKEGKNDSGK